MPDKINIVIRAAQASDETMIRRMIRRERLDPTMLKWQNFLVAEHAGTVVGIGQIKPLAGCNELGSLVTEPHYRGRGVAAALIVALEERAGFPLYLLCAARLEPYYQRHGYRSLGWDAVPPALKRKIALVWWLRIFGIRILVMQKG